MRIPAPCGEDWARMQPTEKGRHCQSCCKTVVDFTEMSDAEIIRHLSQAGPHVCGRLMPDQLNRTLVPAPVQKNGRSGWAWVLASLLMLAKGSDTARPRLTGKIEMREPRAPEPRVDADTTFARIGMSVPRIIGEDSVGQKEFPGAIQGDIVSVAPIMGKPATRLVPDTDRVKMGAPAVIKADSIRPPADTSSTVAPGVTKSEELTSYTGGIVVGVKVDSAIDILTDTVSILTDTVKRIVADTLAAFGWRPAPDLNIYPNPVSRGGSIQLAWKTQPGQYQLTLMDTRGQLIAERILDVGSAGQVDSWEIPASLAAGIYILRVVRHGGAETGGTTGAAAPTAVCTREVMVR